MSGPHEICSCLFGQRRSHQWPAEGNFVGLWQSWHPVLPCTKEEILVLLVGERPPKALSSSESLPVPRILLYALKTVLGDTAYLPKLRIDVLFWSNWTTYATSLGSKSHLMLPVVMVALAKWKSSKKKPQKR